LKAKLDYSLESLHRIDALLDQIRQKFGPTPGGFGSEASQMNFCLTLAFYMGTLISRQGKSPIQWFSYAEAKHNQVS
jgi:hypothetical protein